MSKKCDKCGCEFEDSAKFCPGCGQAVPAEPDAEPKSDQKHEDVTRQSEPIENEVGEQRVFILREKRYGDTEQFDDPNEYKEKEVEKSTLVSKSNVSLYLSIIAVVLSVTAVALVILFAVLPANDRTQTEATAVTEPAATAPTQPPTEPPIKGSYSLKTIDAESPGLTGLLLKNSSLELQGDFTGKLMMGDVPIGDVILDNKEKTALFLNKTCDYSFDGKLLIITYDSMKLVYIKDMQN